MDFYTLIHIGAKQINTNIKNKSSIYLYTNLAYKLSLSLNIQNHRLIILTNNRKFIIDHLKKKVKNINIDVIQIKDDFANIVPDFTRFKAAHAKIDCFNYLSNLNSQKPVFLIDSDILLLKEFPKWFCDDLLNPEFIYGYDITRQLISGYGKNVIDSDLGIFLKNPLVKWFGGEIIGASSKKYKLLYETSKNIFQTYLENLQKFNHIGDETIFNVAIQILDFQTIDLGNLNIIERKWSALCLHDQLPINTIDKISLIHLPSSKRFILNLPIKNFKTIRILLKIFLFYSHFINLVKYLLKNFLKFFC